jgi:ketosteroid isomerase-like protein
MTDPVTAARDYLDCWNRKDLAGIAAHLHPDVTFKGPMAEVAGKTAVLASTERMFPMLQGYEIREIFAAGDHVMCVYDFVCHAPVGRCRTAELLTFDDGLIRATELFFDARPFEAAQRARAAA